MRANFAPAERYPGDEADDDLLLAKLSVPTVLSLPPTRQAAIRRRRIEDRNQADLAFYEYAEALAG